MILIPLRVFPVVKPQLRENFAVGKSEVQELVAGSTEGGLKLIQLRFVLGAELAALGLAIEIGTRTIIERRALVFPDPGIGVSSVAGRWRRHGQPQIHQCFFEQAQLRSRRTLSLACASSCL